MSISFGEASNFREKFNYMPLSEGAARLLHPSFDRSHKTFQSICSLSLSQCFSSFPRIFSPKVGAQWSVKVGCEGSKETREAKQLIILLRVELSLHRFRGSCAEAFNLLEALPWLNQFVQSASLTCNGRISPRAETCLLCFSFPTLFAPKWPSFKPLDLANSSSSFWRAFSGARMRVNLIRMFSHENHDEWEFMDKLLILLPFRFLPSPSNSKNVRSFWSFFRRRKGPLTADCDRSIFFRLMRSYRRGFKMFSRANVVHKKSSFFISAFAT